MTTVDAVYYSCLQADMRLKRVLLVQRSADGRVCWPGQQSPPPKPPGNPRRDDSAIITLSFSSKCCQTAARYYEFNFSIRLFEEIQTNKQAINKVAQFGHAPRKHVNKYERVHYTGWAQKTGPLCYIASNFGNTAQIYTIFLQK